MKEYLVNITAMMRLAANNTLIQYFANASRLEKEANSLAWWKFKKRRDLLNLAKAERRKASYLMPLCGPPIYKKYAPYR